MGQPGCFEVKRINLNVASVKGHTVNRPNRKRDSDFVVKSSKVL